MFTSEGLKMKKYLLLISILTMSVVSHADDNLGFMQNQKYVCMGTQAIVGEKTIKVQSLEDAKKYPSRFYIDDDMVLHTDGKKDNIFDYKEDSVYSSKESVIFLKIEDNKRMMFRLLLTGKLKGLTFINHCTETDNWTLVR